MDNLNSSLISDSESNIQIGKDIISNFISSLTGQMFSFGMGIMLLNQTKSPLSFGLSTIIDPIISLLFMIPIGNLVDFGNHKKIITISMIARILALVIFFFSISYFSRDRLFIPVTLFLIVDSISINFNLTAYSSSVRELVNKNHIQRLKSLSQTASAFSMILAPAFGVILYNSLGFKSFILLALISSLVSLLILFSMKFHHIDLETTSEDEKSSNGLQKFKSALHYINELKPIMDTIIIGVLFNLFYSSLVVGIPYIIKEQLSLGNSMVGILDTSSAIGMLIGGLLCNLFTDNTSYRLRIIFPLILTTGSFIGLGLTLSFEPNYFQLALLGTVLMFLFSLGLSSVNIFVSVFLQEHVKSGMLGRVISIMYTSCTAIMPLGILLFTAIFKFVSDGGLVLFFNGLILGICLLLLIPNLMKALKKSSI